MTLEILKENAIKQFLNRYEREHGEPAISPVKDRLIKAAEAIAENKFKKGKLDDSNY